MDSSLDRALIRWLFDTSGPILRYRVATGLMEGLSAGDLRQLRQDALGSAEVRRWLRNLEQSRGIHGSPDTCAENALAYWPGNDPEMAEAFERIGAFLSNPRFQSTPGGYGWDRAKRRCYAAGRVFLACAEPVRRILFLELGAKFDAARRSEWFRQGMARCEGWRTARGGTCFPREMLEESANRYYLYSGGHMGLGEDRRVEGALERESTFRMLWIQKRMQGAEIAS